MQKIASIHAVWLGFILKKIPNYSDGFSMDTFDERLKLQKTIYLLQAFGVYLGYDFGWYLRGPYCSILCTNGFTIEELYPKIPDEKFPFKDDDNEKKFKEFLEFIKEKDIDDLEIAASLHYLKVRHKNMNEDDIKKQVVEKRIPYFDKKRVDEIWEEMKKCQLV